MGDYLTANAGLRFDAYLGTGKLDQTYIELSPRAGVVAKIPVVGNLKLLYGRATRVPNGFETLSSVTILGDPKNSPTQIDNFQVNWLKTWAKFISTEVGGFYTIISNPLVTDANISDEQAADGFIGQFINIDTYNPMQSVGIDGKLALKLGTTILKANFTRYLWSNDGFGKEIAYIPRTMVNVNLNVPAWVVNLNLGANYRGDFSKTEHDSPIGKKDLRSRVKDYVILTFVMSYVPNNWPVKAQLGVRNLANQDIRYPSSSRDYPRHFPARGIEFWGDLTYTKEF